MIDSTLEAAGFVAVGIATGLLSGTLGVGGGFILVPLLTLLDVPLHQAIGTSLAFIAIVALAGGLRHFRQSTADPLLAGSLVLAGALFAQVGARVGDATDEVLLSFVFAAILVAVAVWFYLGPDPEDAPPRAVPAGTAKERGLRLRYERERSVPGRAEPLRYVVDLRKSAGVGALVGFTSGLLGTGGGFLMVPMLVLVLAIPLTVAIGTDLFGVVVTAASGVVAHLALGNVVGDVLLAAVPGGMVAAVVGARLSTRLSQSTLRRAFLAVLVIGACKLLFDGISGL